MICHKISIVTISFNCRKEIERTILSVKGLDYPNIEYIVIDGASKDGTLDIINKYKESIDVIVSEPDKGIYDAMNKGIQKASGDWIIFMNAGDTFHSHTCVSELMNDVEPDTTIVHGDIISVHAEYRYRIPVSPIEEMASHMTVRHQATFTKLEYHKKNLFDITFRSSGDYNFFYQAYFRDHVKFQHVSVVIADFDAYTGTSNVNYRRSYNENLRIWHKEESTWTKIKQQMMFFRWECIGMLKKLILTKEQQLQMKIKMLQRNGVKEIEIVKAE